jgi:UDP:flavonoid glycosyltransferase YjiC (YdhE family)
MHVLLTCVVGYGHFHPMVPLAFALRDAGHRVVVATDPSFCGYVEEVGFEAHPAGLDQPEARARFLAAVPNFSEIPVADRMPIQQAGMFGRVRVPRMLDDLTVIFEQFQPDLVIHDSLEFAGAIAAEAAGVAHAEHAVGLLRPAAARRAATDAVKPFSDALGVPNPGVGGIHGELYLDICPPGIQRPEIVELANVHPIRPMGFDASPGRGLPPWVAGLPQGPTVYVTMGTVFNESVEVFRTILEGIANEPWNVVVTVGETGDPGALGTQPASVHVERYIPQSRLLPQCSLFVSHAGSGAMLGALIAGVPMLALPQGADQFFNADRIVDVGVGLKVLPGDLTAEAVRAAARRLVEDRTFRDSALEQRDAIATMPAPSDVVPVLEALASRRAAV